MIPDSQQDITENEENPAIVPQRSLRASELVELKILARDAKEHLSALWAGLESWGADQKFETTQIRIDDTGDLCDEITKYCTDELKKIDLPKKKKVQKCAFPAPNAAKKMLQAGSCLDTGTVEYEFRQV
jgi:hypothetical protein